LRAGEQLRDHGRGLEETPSTQRRPSSVVRDAGREPVSRAQKRHLADLEDYDAYFIDLPGKMKNAERERSADG